MCIHVKFRNFHENMAPIVEIRRTNCHLLFSWKSNYEKTCINIKWWIVYCLQTKISCFGIFTKTYIFTQFRMFFDKHYSMVSCLFKHNYFSTPLVRPCTSKRNLGCRCIHLWCSEHQKCSEKIVLYVSYTPIFIFPMGILSLNKLVW